MEVIPGKGAVIPLETYDDKGNLALDRTVLRGWSYSQNASFFGNSLYISDHTIRLKGRSNSNVTIGLETVDPRAIYTEVEVMHGSALTHSGCPTSAAIFRGVSL